MRSRGLVVAIAVVLAVLAAVGVIVYTNNVKDTVTTENTVEVVVSTQDIPPSTQLDPLREQGVFEFRRIPDNAVVEGAIQTFDQLAGQTTSAPIYANEQIPFSRLATGESNNLGITPGHVAVGLAVDGPQSVNGYVQQGDNIVVYATFSKGTPVTKAELKVLFSAAQIQKFYDAVTGATTTSLATQQVLIMPFDFTMTLVPSVKVLAILNPPVDQTSGRPTSGASSLVLDLLPTDSQGIVFANEQAKLWLGLLPPDNKDGYQTGAVYGVPFARVIGVNGT